MTNQPKLRFLYIAIVFALALAIYFLAVGCQHPSPPTPPPPVPTPAPLPVDDNDAGQPDDRRRQWTCADVCQKLHNLSCPAGEPTPKGATCLDVCKNSNWNLGCIMHSNSCVAANGC